MMRAPSALAGWASASPRSQRAFASGGSLGDRAGRPHRSLSSLRTVGALILASALFFLAFEGLAVVRAGALPRPDAQDAPNIEAQLTSQVERASLGEPVTLTLEVVHPDGWTAIPQRLPRDWGDFELRWQAAPETALDLDSPLSRMRTTQRIGVRPWMTGSLETPSMTVSLFDPSASRSITTSAKGAIVRVRSVLPPGETLPRDIRPQAVLPVEGSSWSSAAGLAMLALAALAVVISRRLAEQRRSPAPAPAEPPIPPLEAALAALQALERGALPDEGRFKEFYQRASDALRRYLQDALEIDALDSTRREIERALTGLGLPDEPRRRVERCLAESDLVKFARLRPQPSEAEAFLTAIRSLVQELDAWRRSVEAARKPSEPDASGPAPGPDGAGHRAAATPEDGAGA